MTIQIKRFVEGVVNSFMIISQKIITIIFIMIFAFINLKVTILSLFTLVVLYLLFYKAINNIVYQKVGVTSIFNNRQRLISESILV